MFNNKGYYRKLDLLLGEIEHEKRPHHALARMVDRVVAEFKDELGISSGRLYTRDGGVYLLRHSSQPLANGLEGFSIPVDYPPVREIERRRAVAIHEDFPGYDPDLESRLGVSNFAAFSLADGRYLISFGIAPEIDEESLVFALSTIQHTLGLRLRQAAMEAEISEAEAIQASLLPVFPPRFEGYDIAARTQAAEAAEVGGDIHDFIDLGEDSLGIAVGDASGHGLPAALQARDVVTGLRMGVEKEMKITAVIRRLNRVIHASRLSTRFVSLFYGELERNGNLVYVNAGHCESLILGAGGEVERLQTGGVILGPTADASYQRGFTHLFPGSQLLIFTDGLVERSSDGKEFGEKRVIRLFRDSYKLSAAETVDRILKSAKDFGRSQPWEDDVTLLSVKPV